MYACYQVNKRGKARGVCKCDATRPTSFETADEMLMIRTSKSTQALLPVLIMDR